MRSIATARSSHLRSAARIALGGVLVVAGIGHLTFARTDFQAQVPDWVGLDKDLVVIRSGLVEIALGAAIIAVRRRRALLGLAAGLFFVAVFPGNVSQYVDGDDAFGLDSAGTRLLRLFFQPVLVAWTWWSTDALSVVRRPNDLNDPSDPSDPTD
jgi:uncharacterized membrane protein